MNKVNINEEELEREPGFYELVHIALNTNPRVLEQRLKMIRDDYEGLNGLRGYIRVLNKAVLDLQAGIRHSCTGSAHFRRLEIRLETIQLERRRVYQMREE
jgi:hypothetical protein